MYSDCGSSGGANVVLPASHFGPGLKTITKSVFSILTSSGFRSISFMAHFCQVTSANPKICHHNHPTRFLRVTGQPKKIKRSERGLRSTAGSPRESPVQLHERYLPHRECHGLLQRFPPHTKHIVSSLRPCLEQARSPRSGGSLCHSAAQLARLPAVACPASAPLRTPSEKAGVGASTPSPATIFSST
jgi:hypothetical protein